MPHLPARKNMGPRISASRAKTAAREAAAKKKPKPKPKRHRH